MNTPTFGSGKLSDGGVVCTSCFKKINKVDPFVAGKLKKHSLQDIQNLLREKENSETRLNEIKNHIQSLGLDNLESYLGRKEIKELPEILAENEQVSNIIQGTYDNGQGILISTDRRLIFIDKGIMYGLKVEDFPLNKITSIQYETGMLLGKVKIHTSSNVATIDNVEKGSARKFAEFVRDKLSQPIGQMSSQNSSVPNVLEQLEKLAKLKENGIITEEEFTEQKKKLLEKL